MLERCQVCDKRNRNDDIVTHAVKTQEPTVALSLNYTKKEH